MRTTSEHGLIVNIIIGRLIPAGTGFGVRHDIEFGTEDAAPAAEAPAAEAV